MNKFGFGILLAVLFSALLCSGSSDGAILGGDSRLTELKISVYTGFEQTLFHITAEETAIEISILSTPSMWGYRTSKSKDPYTEYSFERAKLPIKEADNITNIYRKYDILNYGDSVNLIQQHSADEDNWEIELTINDGDGKVSSNRLNVFKEYNIDNPSDDEDLIRDFLDEIGNLHLYSRCKEEKSPEIRSKLVKNMLLNFYNWSSDDIHRALILSNLYYLDIEVPDNPLESKMSYVRFKAIEKIWEEDNEQGLQLMEKEILREEKFCKALHIGRILSERPPEESIRFIIHILSTDSEQQTLFYTLEMLEGYPEKYIDLDENLLKAVDQLRIKTNNTSIKNKAQDVIDAFREYRNEKLHQNK